MFRGIFLRGGGGNGGENDRVLAVSILLHGNA